MSLATAIKTGDPTQLPSRRDEDWRWTDLRGLVRQIPPPYRNEGTGLLPTLVRDGEVHRSPFESTRQVSVGNGVITGLGYPTVVPLVFDVHDPVVVLDVVNTGGGFSLDTSLQIRVPAGVNGVLLESHAGEGDHLVAFDLDIWIEDGASLERIVLLDDDPEAVVVRQAKVTLGAGASFAQTILTSGARRQRQETCVEHPGQGASVRMDGVYLLADKRHADITTVVTHQGVDGTTEQLVKGVVDDQARGVFQGRIVVTHGADRTDARMGHHALILSDRAEVDAKPELLINADDVACAHGNTVGALDEEAIFYARQRGIPEVEARAMLTLAFVEEVIDRIGHEGAREIARAWAHRQMGAADGL